MFARLAEDDKDGVMAEKVLKLFWSLAHSQDVTIEIMDQVIYNSSLVLGIRVAGARVFGRSRGFCPASTFKIFLTSIVF